MASGKALRLARKSGLVQAELLADLQALAKSLARSETMILELKEEMEAIQGRHEVRRNTREDIAYLEDLLRCAKKKLVWENQMASLSKRIPQALAKVEPVMNDTRHPPTEELRIAIHDFLRQIQGAMERLELAKVQ